MATTQLVELPVDIDVPGLQQKIVNLEERIKKMEADTKVDVKSAKEKGWWEGFWMANTIWIFIAIAAFIVIYQPWTWL